MPPLFIRERDMAFATTGLNPKLTKRIYEMLWRSYPEHYENKPSDFFKPYIELDPFHNDDSFRVVMDGDKIAGTTKIFYRETFINGEKLLLGGIGLVAVNPEFRGKGLANIIMEDCVQYMEEHNFDVSLLFAGPIPLYEKHGWSSMTTKSWDFGDISIPQEDSNLFFRPLSWQVDYANVYGLHSQMIQKVNLAMVRNPNYWNEYVWKFHGVHSEIFGVEKKGELLAYAIVEYDKKTQSLDIQEYGVSNDSVLPTLVAGLHKEFGFKEIYLASTGASTPLASYLPTISKTVNSNNEDGMMYRNINKKIDINDSVFHDNSLFFGTDSF